MASGSIEEPDLRLLFGDLRSDRVLGRETTHPFHGGHRRHNQDLGTGGTTRGERIVALLVRSTEDLTLLF